MSSSLDSLTPPARLVDPRGQRFGAGLSVVVLAIAFVADAPPIVALVTLALAVSAAFGTRWFAFGRPWPVLRRALRLGPAEPEHEYPPRFAQALGTTFLSIGLVGFATVGEPLAWLPVAAVAGLQAVLALTGFCLGCRLYFLRWFVPGLFARFASRGAPRRVGGRLSAPGA
ncbi:MAG TPA: DUF4395 domain-containing protein [Candidatus Limnocylindrales bacterium]|nr:DUF4395 domain-containing protein [Candidatus Limnocylindrales bacterium]